MEYLEENKNWFLDSLIEKVSSFYEKINISKDGIKFSFESKPNLQRLKFILSELMYHKIEEIPLSDKKLVLDIFSGEMHNHIMSDIVGKKENDPSFDKLLFTFASKLTLLHSEAEKDSLRKDINDEILSMFDK